MGGQPMKGLPIKTRQGVRDLVIRTSNVLSSKKEICVAAFIRRARSRCITSGAVEVREFKICTTDSLSQRKSTTYLNHEGPQM